MSMNETSSRRSFLAALPGLAVALLAGAGPLSAGVFRRGPRGEATLSGDEKMSCHGGSAGPVDSQGSIHPDPRPGIDASEVMTAEELGDLPDNIKAIYDQVREIPHIADGLGCYCGCSIRPGYRSLLTCYYPDGMAMGCNICQGQARLAYRRHSEGQTLEEIRRAIDARFSTAGV
jgi:hypothetical protein